MLHQNTRYKLPSHVHTSPEELSKHPILNSVSPLVALSQSQLQQKPLANLMRSLPRGTSRIKAEPLYTIIYFIYYYII